VTFKSLNTIDLKELHGGWFMVENLGAGRTVEGIYNLAQTKANGPFLGILARTDGRVSRLIFTETGVFEAVGRGLKVKGA
jgi:hypothetical protein